MENSMKWAILCISSGFYISFPYLYTTFTQPLLHFLVFCLHPSHSLCIRCLRWNHPLFCLHTPFITYHRPSNRSSYTYFSTALFILLSACRHTSEDLYPNINPSHGLHNSCLKSHNPWRRLYNPCRGLTYRSKSLSSEILNK